MHLLDPATIAATGGLALIAFIVFAESGLLFGFFFPGDTLLFLTGILASQGQFSLALAISVIVLSAIIGGQVGYYLGYKFGPKVFKKKDGILFRVEYIERSELFYEKHGGKTIMLARFIPIIRTFAPVVAGIGNMKLSKFTLYNILGSAIWGTSVTLAGYYFGSKIPNVDKYVFPLVLLVMILSFGPAFYHVLSNKNSRKMIAQKLSKLFRG
jgi:membrane-associated protein